MTYEKLAIDGIGAEVGSFVKTLEGPEGEVGFQKDFHVHKTWYKQTKSFDEAMEELASAAAVRNDVMTPVKDITAVNDGGEFYFRVGEQLLKPNDWAIQQFSTQCKVPSSSVLREYRNLEGYGDDEVEVMCKIANHALSRMNPEKVFRLRAYANDLRAWVTDKYAPVDNRWYLEVLKEFIPSGRVSHWNGDEDTIYGNILLPDTCIDYGQSDDSDYGAMLSVSNCEIGKRRIGQKPSVFRSICMNGCIWGQKEGKGLNRRHIGDIDLDALKVDIARNIGEQLNLLPGHIHTFLNTAKMVYGFAIEPKLVFIEVGNSFRMKPSQIKECLSQWEEYESEHRNLFGVINAVTRAGQEYEATTWEAFDVVGGELANLSPEAWQTIIKRAATLTVKEVDKVFAE